MFTPKLLTTIKGYTREQALADVTAGIIVGVVALPLAIAFAIASGVSPERGLWTAIIAGFIISVFGGSRVQIGGPTGAFVVIVYGIVQQHGVDGLRIATLMAGVILVVMGLARLGFLIKFVPPPVVTGFTSGIAIIIFSSQVKDFLGLQMGAVPPDFLAKWMAYARSLHTANVTAIVVAVAALGIMAWWPRVNRRIPGPFVALVLTTALVALLPISVETIGSRFGAISSALPSATVPHVSWIQFTVLIVPAFTIALLGAVESLLSAVVSDNMIGGGHRSNIELVAQGIANIVVPIFGGIPATGAIARTATNVKNGGRTPVAGITHSLTLLLITLFAGKWAGLIPMATLSAVLILVAYHMSEWRMFRATLRSSSGDAAVLILTFALTVFVDLTAAITSGVALAAILRARRGRVSPT
ncbi:MAG: SulP family inorganic anion transporter [Gemmatimonas sp.]